MKLSSNNVSHYLLNADIIQKDELELMTITPKPSKGRNNLVFLIIGFPNGRRLFIKQYPHQHNLDVPNKISSEWRLHKFFQACPDVNFTSFFNLQVIHFDEPNSLLIYESPKNLINLEIYYMNQKAFPIKIAELIGTTLACLHHETLKSRNCYDFINEVVEGKPYYQFPYPSHLLDRVVPETLIEEFPPEGYRFLAFYQQSESLRAAVTELVVAHYHLCLTHNNFQLNNILISKHWERLLSQAERSDENIIRLINWENCSWGDPAFDLGTAIASYLLLWLSSLIIHPAVEFDKSLQLATIPLKLIQPSVVTLIRSYISSFPKVLEECPDFLKRVVQFTGLALIYRIIAMIQSFQGFNNQGISTLQLAKSLLCKPEESFKSVFGMTESALLIELIPLANLK